MQLCGNCGNEIVWDLAADCWMHPDMLDLNRYKHCGWDAPIGKPWMWDEDSPVAELETYQRRIL